MTDASHMRGRWVVISIIGERTEGADGQWVVYPSEGRSWFSRLGAACLHAKQVHARYGSDGYGLFVRTEIRPARLERAHRGY